MKLRLFSFSIVICWSICLGLAGNSWSACDGADMEGSNNCIFYGGFGTVGGGLAGGNFSFVATDMYPYQQRSTENDLEYWYARANTYYDQGYGFRQNLFLVDVVPDSSTSLGRMLLDPKLNYETAGLLDTLPDIENNLFVARDIYAYDLFRHYPDDATAKAKLLNSIKELATIHLMIADEFLIDALEYRFSAESLLPDAKLDEQIALLDKARIYYQKALMTFISGFSPAVGTNIYVSGVFDDATMSLFNLSLERLSMTMREKSSRQLVRQMSPDASEEWLAARQASLGIVKDIATTAYITAAATADRARQEGLDFRALGGDRLSAAIREVTRQGNIYNSGLNPLGYDNRYVPMNDFENLYRDAGLWLQAAKEAKSAFDNQKREFDANSEKLRDQIASFYTIYIANLASMTGCAMPLDPYDPVQVEIFIDCTGEAGGDLFDCPLTASADDFETCLAGKSTKGILASKYRNIKDAQTRLEQARQRRQDILTRIENENELHHKMVQLKRRQLGEHTTLLDEYYNKLKNARTETDTVTYTSIREKDDDGDWGAKQKRRDHTTTETFTIRDDNLRLETGKAKELLRLTTDYEILLTDLQSAATIKDLLLSEAEAEIDIELAAQQKNSALADFDNTFMDKENQWFLYQRSLDQLKYCTERTPTLRLLQSQEAVHLSETLNYTAHYAYLAAKALEYKYLQPLVDIPVGGGRLRLTDLFKAQTPADMETVMLKLNSFNTANCPWGTFDAQYHTISLVDNILGLSSSPDDVKKQKLAAFINERVSSDGRLEFSFSLSEDNTFLVSSGLFNLKIWNGASPASCGSMPGDVKGLTVSIKTTQSSNLRPKVRLRQAGHSSFRNASGDILEYIPIYDSHLLTEDSDTFIPSKQAEFVTYVNVDPRYQSGTGQWVGAFKGRGLSSSEWTVTLFDWNPAYARTDLSKITDILLYIDTIGQCCYF